jgi:HK97 family phage major capsid protein
MTILGYPLISTWDMPTAATSAKSLLFGDLSQFKIRFANQMTLVRQVEALATTGQVGFVATWRMDSNLADAGTHPVYVFQGAAT